MPVQPLSASGRLYAVAAFAEALTWTGLLIGMWLKYAAEVTDLGVWLFGRLHGAAFLFYLAATLVTASRLRWPGWALLLDLDRLLGGDAPRTAYGMAVNGDYLPLLSAQPRLGRILDARDEQGASVTLRVESVARDPQDADGDVFLYELAARDGGDDVRLLLEASDHLLVVAEMQVDRLDDYRPAGRPLGRGLARGAGDGARPAGAVRRGCAAVPGHRWSTPARCRRRPGPRTGAGPRRPRHAPRR